MLWGKFMQNKNQNIIEALYRHISLIGKRVWHNYYLKNWIDYKKNRKLLENVRKYSKDDTNGNTPLISVQIPTYNRSKILTERAIPSVLKQTYQNFEIVVVGDHCTDDTEELIKNIDDNRIKFYNLAKRGNYPIDPMARWMVAGAIPANKGIELCTGNWIAPLDDDDEFSEDHLETLLKYALQNNYEMVYGIVQMEREPDKWKNVGYYPLNYGKICHISVLYSSKLKFFKYDINAWKYLEPGDWNLWRRMKKAGVRIGFIDKVVGKHYLEGTQRGV
jgi:glycosyltransferase involved in cell wall biosynthesis